MIKCSYTKIVDIDTIVPNPRNPNKHPQEQIDMLAKIIKYQGQRLPIVVSKRSGFIVSGHGRLLAMLQLGFKEVAIDEQDFKTEAEEYAHMIADNKIAELSINDDKMMVDDLKLMDFDLDLSLLGIKDLVLNDFGSYDDVGFDPTVEDERKLKTCPHCGEAI
jgi:ParB-like chromosome segregation protein Spo0J